jgi:SAM-dependent methyltransferase
MNGPPAAGPASSGYVTDVPYCRNFVRELAPSWLDHVALLGGFTPPDRQGSFAWCDLGCGPGVTAAILASTHPAGSFHGIDALPDHIDFAQGIASEASVSNATFHCADFSQASDRGLPSFDYIVSHGVYSWVDRAAKLHLRHFIDRHLKPGGLVYVSYNAMPGRASDLPYQRLVRALGESLPGNSQEQAVAATGFVRSLTGLKAPSLVGSMMAALFDERQGRVSPLYLAHELMNACWDVLCVTEVRAEMAELGLKPIGSATLLDNHDSFVLGRAAREALANIADDDVRELARDYLIDQFFRRDVFIRGGLRLSPESRRSRLMDSAFFLAKPSEPVELAMKTPAGKLTFDNQTSRHIVRALAGGPRRLSEIADPSMSERDLIANTLALSAADMVLPVNAGSASTAALNAVILGRQGGEQEICCLGLPCGTSLPVESELLGRIKNGESLADDAQGAWLQSCAGF